MIDSRRCKEVILSSEGTILKTVPTRTVPGVEKEEPKEPKKPRLDILNEGVSFLRSKWDGTVSLRKRGSAHTCVQSGPSLSGRLYTPVLIDRCEDGDGAEAEVGGE